MTCIWDNPLDDECYEALELPFPLDPLCFPNRDPRGGPLECAGLDWRGPLTAKNMEQVRQFLPIHVKAYGGKKYTFEGEYGYPGGRTTWCYHHCSGKSMLLIRKVLPSPEIHVVMQSYFPDWRTEDSGFTIGRNEVAGVYKVLSGSGEPMYLTDPCTKLTAVAENHRSIMTYFVTQDQRCGHFKDCVKSHCVAQGLCTRQTNLTIYFDNVIMSSSMWLHRNAEDYDRRHLPRIISAKDGSPHTTSPQSRKEDVPTSPQSRTEKDTDSEEEFPEITPGKYWGMLRTKTSLHPDGSYKREAIIDSDDEEKKNAFFRTHCPGRLSEGAAAHVAVAAPSPKKRKAAVADSGSTGSSQAAYREPLPPWRRGRAAS